MKQQTERMLDKRSAGVFISGVSPTLLNSLLQHVFPFGIVFAMENHNIFFSLIALQYDLLNWIEFKF